MAGFSPRIAAVAAVVVLAPAVGACGYNTIPTKQERAEAAWADVQSQYQRRADLEAVGLGGWREAGHQRDCRQQQAACGQPRQAAAAERPGQREEVHDTCRAPWPVQ